MRNITIKLFLLGLFLFTGKISALGQNTDIDIKCEVGGLNFNLPQADPDYGFDFGGFSVFAEGEKVKEEEGAVKIVKYYKLPQTKLILTAFVVYSPKGKMMWGNQWVIVMVLSKKKVPFSSEAEFGKFFDIDVMTKNVIDTVQVIYSMKVFDGSEGIIVSMPYLGKKKPVHIMMKCKKVKKAGS